MVATLLALVVPFGWETMLVVAVVVGPIVVGLEVVRARGSGPSLGSRALETAHSSALNGRDAIGNSGSQFFHGPGVLLSSTSGSLSVSPQPGLAGWQTELYELLCRAFSADELRKFAQLRTRLPHGVLREPPATATDVAFDVVNAVARQRLVDDALFDALLAERPGHAAEVCRIRGLWMRTSAPPSPPRMAIVLDRLRQWSAILEACATSDRHLIILVHGDHEQDLDLFMLRIERFFTEECEGRRHRLVGVARSVEHAASTGGDWARRLVEASGEGEELVDALLASASKRAVVYLFGDHKLPLEGLRWPEFEGLVALFRDYVAPAIAACPPAHPLRFVLPFQHREDGKTIRDYVRRTAGQLDKLADFRVLTLDELDFPPPEDVLAQVEKEHADIYEEVREPIRALHDELSDRTLHPQLSILAFGVRLQKILDQAVQRRRRARVPGPFGSP